MDKSFSKWFITIFILGSLSLISACGSGGGGGGGSDTNITATYTVTYDGNSNTGGSVPIDSTHYEQGQTVTVLGNTGNLVRTTYAFSGWNTASNGTGTSYTQAQTFAMGSTDVTLYAKWSITLPAAPAGLVVSAVTSTRIDISWTDGSNNEAGYKIERSTNGTLFTELAVVNMDITNFSDTGLTPSATYYYRVKAYNNAGNSNYSNIASTTTFCRVGGNDCPGLLICYSFNPAVIVSGIEFGMCAP